jgi:hypothetical protein
MKKLEQNFLFKSMFLYTVILVCLVTGPVYAQNLIQASTLPDVSGMAWIEDDLFLVVHDAKNNPEKHNWPRVSIVQLPELELKGVTWNTLDMKFPGPEGPSSDLESACSIPGRKAFLFAESGQEGEDDRRIFYAVYDNDMLQIESYIVWPEAIKNVEATEVCQVNDQLIFVYAERSADLPSTKLRWAPLSLDPLKIGDFEEITFEGIDPVGKGARPIVAMDIDSDGFIYIISSYDSGSDDGPYRSVLWQIGKVRADKNGSPKIDLIENKRLANLDGLKVESIAIREQKNGSKQIFIGTDDEHFGGIIRLLPALK